MAEENEEHGWFHPDRGYWQTTGMPDQRYIDDYPAGTTTYPLKPGDDYEPWDGGWRPTTPEPLVITPEMVNYERDRRIDAGFLFQGALFQLRAEDRENIAGAKSAATDAITMFNAQPGNLAWQQLMDPNAPEEFHWIAADNTMVPMDAQTTFQFGYVAMNHKQAHIFAARAIKDMPVIPADFATNPSYWPNSSVA